MFVYSNEPANFVIQLEPNVTEISLRVEDEDGLEIIPDTSVIPDSDNKITIEVPAEKNVLVDGSARAFRVLFIKYKTVLSASFIYKEESYAIYPQEELMVQVNSFQTYNQALFRAYGLTGIDEFNKADRETKIIALENAWRSLVSLRYSIDKSETTKMTRIVDFPDQDISDLTDYDAAQFEGLDPDFLEAIKRAQIIQAAYILTGKDVEKFEETKSVTSVRIGEAQESYKISNGLNAGNSFRAISARAMAELKGYLNKGLRIGRA